MATSSITGTTTANTPRPVDQRKSLAEQFDGFLVLLTTQLKNQDPLSPMDANQFTAQLVQFTGVEQSVNMNKKLDDMLKVMRADPFGTGSQYLGKEIEANGNRTILGETGDTTIGVNLPDGVAAAVVTILDANGEPLRVLKAAATPGSQSIAWDGRNAEGKRMPPGPYAVRVDAVNDTGTAVSGSTGVRGIVTGVESRYGGLILTVGDMDVPLADVHAVRSPTPATAG